MYSSNDAKYVLIIRCWYLMVYLFYYLLSKYFLHLLSAKNRVSLVQSSESPCSWKNYPIHGVIPLRALTTICLRRPRRLANALALKRLTGRGCNNCTILRYATKAAVITSPYGGLALLTRYRIVPCSASIEPNLLLLYWLWCCWYLMLLSIIHEQFCFLPIRHKVKLYRRIGLG